MREKKLPKKMTDIKSMMNLTDEQLHELRKEHGIFAIDDVFTAYVKKALLITGYRRAYAALLLGVGHTTMYRWTRQIEEKEGIKFGRNPGGRKKKWIG